MKRRSPMPNNTAQIPDYPGWHHRQIPVAVTIVCEVWETYADGFWRIERWSGSVYWTVRLSYYMAVRTWMPIRQRDDLNQYESDRVVADHKARFESYVAEWLL